jgi:hypothetical protein
MRPFVAWLGILLAVPAFVAAEPNPDPAGLVPESLWPMLRPEIRQSMLEDPASWTVILPTPDASTMIPPRLPAPSEDAPMCLLAEAPTGWVSEQPTLAGVPTPIPDVCPNQLFRGPVLRTVLVCGSPGAAPLFTTLYCAIDGINFAFSGFGQLLISCSVGVHHFDWILYGAGLWVPTPLCTFFIWGEDPIDWTLWDSMVYRSVIPGPALGVQVR